MKKLSFAFAGVLLAGLPTTLSAITIDAKTNIFVAGQDSTGISTQGGLFPGVAQTFIPGAGKSVTFAVTPSAIGCGAGACAVAGTGDGADLGLAGATAITPLGTNGVSGITFLGREMFLAGVFLDNSVPTGVGPSTLTFVSTGGSLNADTDTSFAAFLLGQVFFIGDGRTGFNNAAGTLQTFAVPTNATRLYLGFADANGFVGSWGGYGDNTGALNLTVNTASAVPEPGTITLLCLGVAGLACFRKRISSASHN